MTRFSWILVLCLLLAPKIWAQGEKITLEGELYDFDRAKQILHYKNPRASLPGAELMGQQLTYFKDENRMEFAGNIVIRAQDYLITAQRGSYNLKTRRLEVQEVSLYDYVNLTYISAQKVTQLGPQHFEIEDAVLTLCEPEAPAWQFKSAFINYQIDDFAYSVNTWLEFNQLPIFYTPIVAWPTRRGRSSGLLAPEFLSKNGDVIYSHNYGSRLKLPYFWAIDRDQDLTVTPDIISGRGLGLGLEYRWAFLPGMYGEALFWGIDESVQDRNLAVENLGSLSADQVDRQPTRYWHRIDHRQQAFDGQLMVHEEARSDNEVDKEYNDVEIGTQLAYRRALSWTYPWSGGGLSLERDEGANFLYPSTFDPATDADTYLNRDYALRVDHREQNIADTGLSMGGGAGVTQYSRTYGWNGDFQSGYLEVEYPFNLDFLNFVPSVRRDQYQLAPTYALAPAEGAAAGFETEPTPYGWGIDSKRLEVNLEVFKVNRNNAGFGVSRLSFTPRVVYEEVADVDQRLGLARSPGDYQLTQPSDTNGPVDDYGRWGNMFTQPAYGRQVMTYQLDSLYLTKDPQTKAVHRFLFASLAQPYNLLRKDSQAEIYRDFVGPQVPESLQETSLGNQRMPLRINLSLSPVPGYGVDLFYRFDHELGRMIENRVGLSAGQAGANQLYLGYSDNNIAYMELDGTHHAQTKSYSLDQTMILGDRRSLHFAGVWDLSRSDPSFLYGDPNWDRLEQQLTSFSAELLLGHQCFDYRMGYREQLVAVQQGSRNFEQIDRRLTFSMELAKWPSSNNPYQRFVDFQ
ncbi:MAG: hypothetical protein RRB13_06080 [bacterium]|nr:hypothetical protein [bacterium]